MNIQKLKEVEERAREFNKHILEDYPPPMDEMIKQYPPLKEYFEQLPKEEAAFWVYSINKENPKLSIEVLCALRKISSGYFRALRLKFRKEWDMRMLNLEEENIQFMIEKANDPNTSQEEWVSIYGKEVPRGDYIVS